MRTRHMTPSSSHILHSLLSLEISCQIVGYQAAAPCTHAGYDAELRLGRSDSLESGCLSTAGSENVLAAFSASTELFCDTLAGPSPEFLFQRTHALRMCMAALEEAFVKYEESWYCTQVFFWFGK